METRNTSPRHLNIEKKVKPPIIYCKSLEKLLSPQFTCITDLETYKCEHCKFSTNFRVDLTRHASIHKLLPKKYNSVQYSCQKCYFATHSLLVLLKHVTDSCKILQWFKCKKCPFRTSHNLYLHRHEKAKHTALEKVEIIDLVQCELSDYESKEEKWFSCDQCPFSAKLERCLKIHKEAHCVSRTDVFFQCPLCAQKTTRKESLRRHMREKHIEWSPIRQKVLGVQWFQCELCSYSTECLNSLQVHHLLTHQANTLFVNYLPM